MEKRIMKTKIIKKYFGDVIKEYGFECVGADSVAWKFSRQKGEVSQDIYIARHQFFPNMVSLSIFTGMPGWGMQEPKDFIEKYKNKEYWKYETEEEFLQMIQEFARIIKEYGLEMLEKMSVPKDSIYATREMNQYLYESYETIVAEANRKYDLEKSGEEGIANILDMIFQRKDEGYDDVKMFLIEMAALYAQIIMNDIGGKLSMEKGECLLKGVGRKMKLNSYPVFETVEEWKYCHNGIIKETNIMESVLLIQYRQMTRMF